ncbi:MAG: hypothetical protein QG656_2330, partial [Candidatus Hydrogenedentes bacterium]|nr:hypothetical protein [Candidatus Hydrogenedentota bacterium]
AVRGEEIGVFRENCLVFGGRLRFSATENVVNPGNFSIVDTSAPVSAVPLCVGKITPAWDDDGMVCVQGRHTQPVYYTGDDIAAFAAAGKASHAPKPAWTGRNMEGRDVVSLALTPNAVLAVCETPVPRNIATRWALCTLDRKSGALRGEQNLGGPAMAGGLLIDRDGRVVVTLTDGNIECFGGPEVLHKQIDDIANRAGAGAQEREAAVTALQRMLSDVRNDATRQEIVTRLSELGVEVGDEARKAGCIVTWKLLGPVPWNEDNPTDKALAGEPDVQTDKPCTIDGTELAWTEFVSTDPNGKVDLASLFGGENVAVYAYAEVQLEQAGDLLLKTGSNDGYKCWFNGVEAGRFDGGRLYRPDQDKLPVSGKQGLNTVLMKVTQMGGGWAFSARIANPDDSPVALPR